MTIQDFRSKIGKKGGAGRLVTDVICKCGHSVKQHKSVRLKGRDISASDRGKGQCTRCGCDVFRFRRYRYA